MPENPSIIIFRFSAMGDVAMSAAVIREFCQQHPHVHVIMVSREVFRPFFTAIAGLVFHPIHPKTTHRGFSGLYRLFRELRVYQPTAVADLHYNVRSRMLSLFFRVNGVVIRHIDKGRKEKKALTRRKNKVMNPLRPTTERYADVFRALGYPCTLSHQLVKHPLPLSETAKRLFADNKAKKIGIAPFAQHAYKIYPLHLMESVLDYLNKADAVILIFGGGKTEKRVAETWQNQYRNVQNLIGRFDLQQELAVISHLDLMLGMDSAGMHIASLMGTRVLSLWGPTHPYAGFLGYGQRMEDCIQADHPARPSSVYGNKPCICDGRDSMELIHPQSIIIKLQELGI